MPLRGTVPSARAPRPGYPDGRRSSYTPGVAPAGTAAAADVPLRQRRVAFLLDAASKLERQLLEDWIATHHVPTGIPYEVVAIPSSRRARRRPGDKAALEGCLASPDDPLLTPLRV